MKNTLDGINSRLGTHSEEKINYLKDIIIEIKQERKKWNKK